MNVRPILFQGEMIRALLREIEQPGTGKTMTRRIVKPGPPPCQTGPGAMYRHEDGWRYAGCDYSDGDVERCPYGQPGDRLWVREAWAAVHFSMDPETGYADDWYGSECIPPNDRDGWWSAMYRATDPAGYEHREDRGWAWRPSIHMPRWASRLTLELTGVRVERVQDISEADAQAEGITQRAYPTSDGWLADDSALLSGGFAALWESINGADAWKENPWVWALTFKPHLMNIDEYLRRAA